MAETKKEIVLDFLSNAYTEYDIDYRENSVTSSYDFVIDTGTAIITLKVGEKRWHDSNNTSIVTYLESKGQQVRKALLNNQNDILPMK